MGIFKSKEEKHNRRMKKMLGKQPIHMHLDSLKQVVHLNFSTFQVVEIDTITVDYEQINTYNQQTSTYEYDFWKGYTYAHLSEEKWGWLMGLKQDITKTSIGVFKILVNVHCIDEKQNKTFTAGIFLENDPTLHSHYHTLWNQCFEINIQINKIKDAIKQQKQSNKLSRFRLNDDPYKLTNCYISLIEGMDVTVAQINKELDELSTAMQEWQKEFEIHVSQINTMIDRYNALTQQKLEHIQKAGIQIQEQLQLDTKNLSFEGKEATYLIENGNYIVGEDIAAGKYHYIIVSGSAYTCVTNVAEDKFIINNAITDEKSLPWIFRNLKLKNGDTIYLNGDAKGMLIRI